MKPRLSSIGAAVLLVGLLATPAQAFDNEFEVVFLGVGGHDLEYEVHYANRRGAVDEVSTKGAISRPAVSPNGKTIAFSGLRNQGDTGLYPLYVMNKDGTGLTRLTDIVGADTDPAWSPDGKQIAYSRNTVGNLNPATCCDIWVIDADGTDATEVPNTQGGINPAWSPDGDLIAFETPSGLFTVEPDGGSLTQIASAGAREPAWSPAGDEIAFVRFSNAAETQDELVVLNVGSSVETVVYDPSSRVESPTWVDEDIYVTTYQGFGYDDRVSSVVRTVRTSGSVNTVVNPSEEIIFVGQAIDRCNGLTLPGSGSDGVLGIAATGDCFGASLASGDFDGDGFDDIAVGVRGDGGAGAVSTLYGGPSGLSDSGDDLFDQDDTSVSSISELGDAFGHSLAVGDFDDDGYDDLAIGVPEENLGSTVDTGAVEVVYGSSGGLNPADSQAWTQNTTGISGLAEADDLFGFSLAVGDFDGNGVDDLAIGAPGEDVNGEVDAGAVSILLGTSGAGLSANGNHRFDQDAAGIKGVGEDDDLFAWSLAAADFDDDGVDDLAIGAPGEDVSGRVDTGAVSILYGSVGVGVTARDHRYDQDSAGIKGVGETDDLFGWSLAAGDFDADGVADLGVGTPGEDISGKADVGAINVMYGVAGTGVSASDQRFDQAQGDVQGAAEKDDRVGYSMAAGDINGDGRDDLVVGAPWEDRSGNVDAGGVLILHGSDARLNNGIASGWFDQGSSGVPGANEDDDRFGYSVALGDFDGDNIHDAAIGVPGEDLSSAANGGGINTMEGSGAGLGSNQLRFDQGS